MERSTPGGIEPALSLLSSGSVNSALAKAAVAKLLLSELKQTRHQLKWNVIETSVVEEVFVGFEESEHNLVSDLQAIVVSQIDPLDGLLRGEAAILARKQLH